MSLFHIGQYQTSPALVYTLDPPTNLAGATVTFTMTNYKNEVIIDGAAAVVQDNSGVLRYDWAAGDTDEAGYFKARFESTYADSTKEKWPTPEWIEILITPALKPAGSP